MVAKSVILHEPEITLDGSLLREASYNDRNKTDTIMFKISEVIELNSNALVFFSQIALLLIC